MDGPAKLKEPGAKEPDAVDGEREDLVGELQDDHQPTLDDEESRKLPSCMEEQLLGRDEASAEDPLSQVQVMQRQLQPLQEEGNRLVKRQHRARQESGNVEEQVAINAGREQFHQHFLDLQEISRIMIPPELDVLTVSDAAQTEEHHQEKSLTAAYRLQKHMLRHDPEFDKNADAANIKVYEAQLPKPSEIAAATERLRPAGSSGDGASVETVQDRPTRLADAGMVPDAAAAATERSRPAGLSGDVPTVESVLEQAAPKADATKVLDAPAAATERPEGLNIKAAMRSPCLSRSRGFTLSLNFSMAIVPMSFERVFSCLLLRGGLEYTLASDSEPYKAKPMPRWGDPTMVMVFASTLRSLLLLRPTKHGSFAACCAHSGEHTAIRFGNAPGKAVKRVGAGRAILQKAAAEESTRWWLRDQWGN